MKKFLAVSIIAILYLSPLAVFAQRRTVAKDQPGKYQAEYKYDAVEDKTETNPEGSNYKSFNRHSTTTMHAQFQSSELVTVRHTNFISIFDNKTPQAGGTCSLTYSSEEHNVSSDDLRYDATEQSAFTGTVTEAGGLDMEFPDTGDTPQNAGAGAKGTGSGFYKKTSQGESWVYNPDKGQNFKKMMPPETDTTCQQGNVAPVRMTGGIGGDADSTKPPESACSGTFEIGGSMFTRKRNAEDANDGTFIGEAAVNGSFAAGKYKMSLTRTDKPFANNRTKGDLTETMTETWTLTVTLLIGGAATAEISAPAENCEPILTAETLMPDEKRRFLFGQSSV